MQTTHRRMYDVIMQGENGSSSQVQDDDDDIVNVSGDPDFFISGRKARTPDPQIVVTGRYKEGAKGDLIIFTIPLALFQIVCIVNVPGEDEEEAPVYVKFKVGRAPKRERTEEAEPT